MACNGNRVDQDALREAVEVGLGRLLSLRKFAGTENRTAAGDERGRIVKRMLRAGLLDRTGHLPHESDQTPEAFYCPIPSLLDHALTKIGTSREAMNEILAGEGLA